MATTLDDFKQFVADEQAAAYYTKWIHDNPNDAQRWYTFRDAVIAGQKPTPPTMTSNYGKGLVDAGKEYLDSLPAPTPPPPPPPAPSGAPVNKVAPNVLGTPAVGTVIHSDSGVWDGSPTSYKYVWENDASGSFAPIDNGTHTAAGYQVQTADQGHNVRCSVTAINAGGSATARSNSVSVTAAPTPAPPGPTPTPPAPTGHYLFRLNVTGTGNLSGLSYQDDTNVQSDSSISRGHISVVSDPVAPTRKAVKFQLNGGGGQREAAEILMPFDPVLGRHRFIGVGLYLPAGWTSLPRGAESSGFWGGLFFQGHYAGIHGCPIGLSAQKDRIAVDIMSGNSSYDHDSQFQTNLISGGNGTPTDAPSCCGRLTGRPGELVAAPLTVNGWNFFVVEVVEAWDFTGMCAIWVLQGTTWVKTWQMNNIPTHQFSGSWSAFGRNDKHGYYTPNVGSNYVLGRDGYCSADTLADAAASLGV